MENKVFGKPGFKMITGFIHPDSQLIKRLSSFTPAEIGDGIGRRGIMDAGIKPLENSTRLCGPALTVEVPPGDNLMIHAALKLLQPGDVLVINGHGDTAVALWGMNMTTTALMMKAGGLIVDGCIRDSNEIRNSGFPTFARGVNPAGPQKNGPGQINTPISCGGVPVHAGDVVVGDGDGVIVVPAELLEFAVKHGEAAAKKDQDRQHAIRDTNQLHQSWLIPTLRAKGLLGETEEI